MKEILQTLEKFDKIVFIGGGTGGHISPIIALHKELSHHSNAILWIGGKKSEEEKEAQKAKIPFSAISILKLSSTKSLKTLLYPFTFIKSFFEAKHILQDFSHHNTKVAIFSKGGPGALAIGLAGKSLKIPIFIHESDTIPGHSNMKMGKFAEKIFLGFESAKKFFKKEKCITVGQILDSQIFEKNPKQKIFWKTNKPHILVICGSQGAKSVFEEIIHSCKNIDAEWIIILGKLNTNMRKSFQDFPEIQILDWLEKSEQNEIFSHTNVAITRGSATTLAELDVFSIKKIIVPLPLAAKNHQFFNAKEYERKGDILLEQKNIRNLKGEIEKNLQ